MECDLEPCRPFENHSMKLALTQVGSEELTSRPDLCSGVTAMGHPVTPEEIYSNTSKAISKIHHQRHRPFLTATYRRVRIATC